jgi:hypothetical protein
MRHQHSCTSVSLPPALLHSFPIPFSFPASARSISKARTRARASTIPRVPRRRVLPHSLLQLIKSNDLDFWIDLERRCKTAREHNSTRTKPLEVSAGLLL